MLAVSNIGGGAVVRGYPWRQFEAVIDVAGGLGGFMAQLLSAVPSIRHGVVLDQPAQIKAARKVSRPGLRGAGFARPAWLSLELMWLTVMDNTLAAARVCLLQLWSSQHGSLLPHVQLVAGNMFDPATLPSPPSGASSTAFVLRNILHDWGDEDCVRILRALRSRCAGSSSSSRVRLLVIEVTTAHEVLPCHAPVR